MMSLPKGFHAIPNRPAVFVSPDIDPAAPLVRQRVTVIGEADNYPGTFLVRMDEQEGTPAYSAISEWLEFPASMPQRSGTPYASDLWDLFNKYEGLMCSPTASDERRIAWASMCNAIARLLAR